MTPSKAIDEGLRAFVAIETPPEVKKAVGELIVMAQRAGATQLRWVEPQGIHLTLKFLGTILRSQVEGVIGVIAQASQGVAPFSLWLEGAGAFPHLRAPRVFWAGLAGELGPLQALYHGLEEGLDLLGFPPEGRSFNPHLTLGRVRPDVSPGERRRLGEMLAKVPPPPEVSFPAKEVGLIQSTLTPRGAVYTRLYVHPLGRA